MEMKGEREIGSDGDSSGKMLPEDLVIGEVLTRLPAKPLMRFKCVSKLWWSTICRPSFCKAHRALSRSRPGCLLMVCSLDTNDPLAGVGFFSAAAIPLSSGGGVLEWRHLFSVGGGWAFGGVKTEGEGAAVVLDGSKYYSGVTEVINGHFCLYSGDQAAICNISTREIMELPRTPPPPPLAANQQVHFSTYKYFLGFDSSHKEYKLLRVRTSSIATVENHQRVIRTGSECVILTLGGNKDDPAVAAAWRCLQCRTPPIDLSCGQSVYIDGACYWWRCTGNRLTAFSFEEETFRQIYPPPTAERLGVSLHQCGGYLAMATGLVDRRIKLWVLDKYVPESPPSESVHAWTLHLISIPYDFADLQYCLLGNLPTGEMLMAGAEQEVIHGSKSPVSPFYSYNPTEKTLKRFVADNKFPSSITSIRNYINKFNKYYHKLCIYYHEDDITPLDRLVSKT
ncbi:hypothetical protein Vadar_026828 [Vaccinium darrowii]|uniref:Uncharacterized protein n=1 Tax=Vaccinium darrowii TaxID=229202 RepID=A0ACB7Y399_9ERIC|nr:hypothetical protein Vadar_026828 [Vaccinium darrowii]